jgi:signal peptidase I
MEGTLLIGDHLFVDRLAYAPSGAIAKRLLPYREVKRGDIIVFRYPLDIRQMYVKRVIGVPGDRIHIENKVVYLNGRPLTEPYKILIPEQSSDYLNNFPRTPDIRIDSRGLEMLQKHVINSELIVPEGYYFAMGDNRDNSADSRFWGLVPRTYIIGQPAMIWWSYDAPTDQLSDGNIHFDHLADIALHFFTKTRWERTFQLLRSYPLVDR